jgi:hypothetical protein
LRSKLTIVIEKAEKSDKLIQFLQDEVAIAKEKVNILFHSLKVPFL